MSAIGSTSPLWGVVVGAAVFYFGLFVGRLYERRKG